MFGISIYSSFLHLVEKFCVPYLNKETEELIGLHAILMCGYDEDFGFLCVNSWGSEWADKGYFYLPFKYVLDPELSDDFWIICNKISEV